MPDITPPKLRPAENRSEAGPEAPSRARSLRMLWMLLPVLLIVGGAGCVVWWFAGRTHEEVAAAPPPMKVPIITVVGRTVPVYRSFAGTTQALRTVPIQARVTGYLVEQGAADGADVAPGALLYRIDPQDYKAAFAEAQATLAQAIASLEYSRVSQGRNQALAHEGNKVEQRLVKLGDSDGDLIVVTDGLHAGERVITGQLQKIRPGAVVEPEPKP